MSIIYQIYNKQNEYLYIGSTKNSLSDRKRSHLHRLRNNKHHCLLLQKDFNKFDEEDFIFSILETVSEEDRYILEEYYIKGVEKIYNIVKSPTKNITHEKSVIDKISSKNRKFELEELKDLLVDLINNPNETVLTIINKHNITEHTFEHTVLCRDRNQNILDEETINLIDKYKNSGRFKNKKILGGIFFKDPNGMIHEVTNGLTTFAKEHNLLQPKLSELKKGTRKTHKGWTYVPEILGKV